MLLYWQEEYGVFSFDGKRLPNFIAYVERQKEHHVQNKTLPVLERVTDGGVRLAREMAPIYEVGAQTWWDELAAWED